MDYTMHYFFSEPDESVLAESMDISDLSERDSEGNV